MPEFTTEDQQGLQALDYNQRVLAAIGYGIVSGATVSINSGDLSTGNTLTVGSGTVQVGGSDVSVSTQSVEVPAANTLPRKDVVYVDDTGTAKVKTGDPEPAKPPGERGLDTERPAPHHFGDLIGTPLAEVWVSAGSSTIDAGDLYPRRVSPIFGFDTAADYSVSGSWTFQTADFGGSPSNLDNLQMTYSGGLGRPATVIQGEGAVQVPDDMAAAGDAEYAAMWQFLTESGQRIATLSADRAHNHIGFYTSITDFSDGLDYQPEKRFNIQGGNDEVNMDFYTTNNFQIRGSSIFHRVFADAGNDTGYTLHEDGYFVGGYYWDASRQKIRMVALDSSGTSETDMIELDGVNSQVEFNNNELTEFSLPDNSVELVDINADVAVQSDLHSRYTDSEAQTAVDGANVDIAGNAASADTADRLEPGGTTYREEDANSPWKVTSAQSSATYTIDGDYDRIHVDILRASSDGNTVENLRMRINGDSGSAYDFITTSGTRQTSQPYLLMANHNTADTYAAGNLQVMTSGTQNHVPVIGPAGFGGGGNDFLTGHWFGGSGDSVTSIELYYAAGQINDLVARVYGENF